MGQSPSCMPSADPMRKGVKTDGPASDGPMSQTMTRLSSSRGTSPTLHRTSPASFTFSPTPTSPPSPLSLKRQPLSINPDLSTLTPSGFSPSSTSQSAFSSLSSTSHSVLSLFSRLHLHSSKQRDARQWLASTPTGADAARFRHFCPICYRHFTAILATSCCAHNICHECATSYLQAKLPNYLPLAFLPADALPCPCPTCNQSKGVRFIPVSNGSSGRSYVESPRTAALVRQHEREEAEMEEQRHYEGQIERLAQLQRDSERAQYATAAVMA